jgi:hypothetical protein
MKYPIAIAINTDTGESEHIYTNRTAKEFGGLSPIAALRWSVLRLWANHKGIYLWFDTENERWNSTPQHQRLAVTFQNKVYNGWTYYFVDPAPWMLYTLAPVDTPAGREIWIDS